jgi:hypothetical protein
MEELWCFWRSRFVRAHVYNSVSMTSICCFISSVKGMVVSILRRVHKSLECVPRGFGAWGIELAMFGWHFAWWGTRAKVASATPGPSQAREPGVLLRSACHPNNNYMPNDKSPRPLQPTPCFYHHNHNQIMLPKRKFEVESYGSLEARIQGAINVLQERGEEKPNLTAAAREFELPPQRL